MVITENTKTFKLTVSSTITTARAHTLYFDNNIREFTVICSGDVEMLVNRKDSNDKWYVTSIADSDFDVVTDSATRVVETKTKIFYIPKDVEKNFVSDYEIENIFFKSIVGNVNVYLTVKG